MPELCLHCEKSARTTYLRLCQACASQAGICRLYRKTAGWTAERDARIQKMVDRAKRLQPLFEQSTFEILTQEKSA
jgi:hypothetical protein